MKQNLKTNAVFENIVPQTWRLIIYPVAAFLVLAGLNTFLGNLISDYITRLISGFDHWLWVQIGFACFAIPLLFFVGNTARLKIKDLDSQLDQVDKLVQLDSTLFSMMSLFDRANSTDDAKMKAFREFFQEACGIMGEGVHRAAILLPNENQTEMEVKYHLNYPDHSLERMKYGLIEGDPTGSVAAKAFRIRKTHTVHIRKNKNGEMVADDPDFLYFKPAPKVWAYKTFVVAPMVHKKEDENVCVGILLFDSQIPDKFDDMENLLLVLSERAACVLACCHSFDEKNETN